MNKMKKCLPYSPLIGISIVVIVIVLSMLAKYAISFVTVETDETFRTTLTLENGSNIDFYSVYTEDDKLVINYKNTFSGEDKHVKEAIYMFVYDSGEQLIFNDTLGNGQTIIKNYNKSNESIKIKLKVASSKAELEKIEFEDVEINLQKELILEKLNIKDVTTEDEMIKLVEFINQNEINDYYMSNGMNKKDESIVNYYSSSKKEQIELIKIGINEFKELKKVEEQFLIKIQEPDDAFKKIVLKQVDMQAFNVDEFINNKKDYMEYKTTATETFLTELDTAVFAKLDQKTKELYIEDTKNSTTSDKVDYLLDVIKNNKTKINLETLKKDNEKLR